jgi:uncharacterized protein YoxC
VDSSEQIPPEQWQALEALWKTILGLEASIDSSRLSMEGVRSEMETAFRRSMTVDEKVHGLQRDVAQWLEEIVKDHIEPRVPMPDVDQVREQLEHLQKDRQVLFAQGNAVLQECRGIIAEIQRAAGTLQRNAADNARRKRDAGRQKGKFF